MDAQQTYICITDLAGAEGVRLYEDRGQGGSWKFESEDREEALDNSFRSCVRCHDYIIGGHQ